MYIRSCPCLISLMSSVTLKIKSKCIALACGVTRDLSYLSDFIPDTWPRTHPAHPMGLLNCVVNTLISSWPKGLWTPVYFCQNGSSLSCLFDLLLCCHSGVSLNVTPMKTFTDNPIQRALFLSRFLAFKPLVLYKEHLCTEHWGSPTVISFANRGMWIGNKISINM